jgi:transposase InsO family protein
VPDNDDLKLRLIRLVHDSPAGGHPGRSKTLELLSRVYYWPKIYESVRRYIASCYICQRSKASREAYNGLLRPLPIPERRWQDLSVDFIVDLPDSRGYTNILVVVDRLTKMRHLIACSDISAPTVARLFLDNVWKLHGLPDSIISDRGTQFTSAFWNELTKRLRINARLSTAFHPESDGQTERVNGVLEQYLRAYVSYQQDDWSDWLSLAEFAMNNAVSDSTRSSPFFANYGFHPKLGYEPRSDSDSRSRPAYQRPQVQAASSYIDKMQEIEDFLKQELGWAQAVYEQKANESRVPAPAYRVGDKVFLDIRNLKTRRPSKKLDWKNAGPFLVTKVVSPYAYKLELPPDIRIHPVFHTSLLRPSPSDPLPGQIQPPPPTIVIDGEEEYQVEKVEDSRFNRRRKRHEYLVKWRGYHELSWEPAKNVWNTSAAAEFERLYPNKAIKVIKLS